MAMREYYHRSRAVVADRPLLAGLVVAFFVLVFDAVRQLAVGAVLLSDVLSFLWSGTVLGLSILNFANFSHGDLMTGGAFAGWAAAFVVAGVGQYPLGKLLLIGGPGGLDITSLGLSINRAPVAIVFGLVVAAGATALLAVGLDRIVYKPMRGEEGISLLIASVGVALAVRYLLVFFFEAGIRSVSSGSLIPSFAVPIGAGAVNVDAHEVTLIAIALTLLAGVHLLLQRTKLGKAMRAMADNPDLARVTGIPTERIVTATWVIGGALAGSAGYLIALERGTLTTTLGWSLLLLVFAAVILGGIGSVYGAVFGGLIIGVASRLSLIWLPSSFLKVSAFAVMVVVLLVRPSGLFKGVTTA